MDSVQELDILKDDVALSEEGSLEGFVLLFLSLDLSFCSLDFLVVL